MVVPDTSGLDQPFEETSYWVQHVLIILVPIYLLSRNNFIAARAANFKSVVVGVWILFFMHFSFYEFLDFALNINVEFMLCPTPAMKSVFEALPPVLFAYVPSYRSLLAVLVSIAAFPLAYSYLYIARALGWMLGVRWAAEGRAAATAAEGKLA